MKLFIICLIGLSLTACGNSSFESTSPSTVGEDVFEPPVIGDDDDVVVPPVTDDDDDVVVNPEPEICPRYDLVVDSTDQTCPYRNYRFIFNSEMKMTSTQGEIDVLFQKNSSTRNYIACSGSFINTSIMPSLKPLDVTQELTKQIMITHGKVCSAVVPAKKTTIRVIDSATGRTLFDEQVWRQHNGECEFGYTVAGEALRRQLVDFSHTVVDVKAAACQ